METPGARPTPGQARDALAQLADDEAAVRYPSIPRWFFLVMAFIVAGLFLARLLTSSSAHGATIGLAVAALVLGSRYWLNRPGVAWTSIKVRDLLPFVGSVLGAFAVCWAVEATTGAAWVWVLGALAGAVLVVVTGRRYRREFGGA